MPTPPSLPKSISLIAFFLAIALQIAINLFEAPETSYKGLRLNGADLLLPFAGLSTLFLLITQKTRWPQWHMRHAYWWLGALSLVFLLALFNGYITTGEWSRWALFNKAAGWPVLLAYMLWGGWIASNFGQKGLQTFLYPFVLFCILLTLSMLFIAVLRDFSVTIPLSYMDQFHKRVAGLLCNRNAFAVLFVSILAITTWMHLNQHRILPHMLFYTLWTSVPLLLVYNGSRTGFLLVVFVLSSFMLLRFKRSLKNIMFPLITGIIIMTAISLTSGQSLFREKQLQRSYAIYELAQNDQLTPENLYKKHKRAKADSTRVRVFNEATALWKTAPITGTGLGSFFHDQNEHYGKEKYWFIDIIDSTPLWLLTETGMIGLFLFAAFYSLVLRTLWRAGSNGSYEAVFRQSVILALLAFGFASLFHELLYMRFLWVLIGMALAVTPSEKKHQ